MAYVCGADAQWVSGSGNYALSGRRRAGEGWVASGLPAPMQLLCFPMFLTGETQAAADLRGVVMKEGTHSTSQLNTQS